MGVSRPAVLIIGAHFPPEATGNAPYTGALSRSLAARGYRVHVITTHPSYPEWRVYEGHGGWRREEVMDGVEVTRLSHYVPRSPGTLRRLVSEVSFGVRVMFTKWPHSDFTIFVSPALFSTTLALISAQLKFRREKTAIWVQDLYSVGLSETGATGPVVAAMRVIEGAALRAADRVIAIHDRFADRIRREFKVDGGRIRVIRNWTHLAEFGATDRDADRVWLGWGAQETVALHAGNIGVKQGLENLVRAAQTAEECNSSVRFVILGGGTQLEGLTKLAGSCRNIQFLEAVSAEAFPRLLKAADCLVVNERPGVAEMAVPSKLTSYFAAARPVVAATDPEGITAEEIARSNAGVVVPAGDPEALLRAVIDVSDDSRAAQYGRNGLAYRRSQLSEGVAVDRFVQLIDEATRSR